VKVFGLVGVESGAAAVLASSLVYDCTTILSIKVALEANRLETRIKFGFVRFINEWILSSMDSFERSSNDSMTISFLDSSYNANATLFDSTEMDTMRDSSLGTSN
jgi:hypothetical protein